MPLEFFGNHEIQIYALGLFDALRLFGNLEIHGYVARAQVS